MNRATKNLLVAIGIPTIYAIVLRLFFGIERWNELFEVMSFTFLFFLPTIVGGLTVYLSDKEKVEKLSYRIFTPWVPIFLFLVFTLAFAIEGWACWLVILPIFLIAASIGGIIGGHLKLNKKNDRLNVSVMIFLPLIFAPLESFLNKIPANYEAYTFIDIRANPEKIWDNVTRVEEIEENEDSGWLNKFLGLPRPIKATLDYEGVGA